MSESFSIQSYLDQHPDMTALEILTPDMNGMFRVKRIPRDEAPTFFEKGLTGPGTMHLMNSLGDMAITPRVGRLNGDPDRAMKAVPATLTPIPWLASETHQVLSTWEELDGQPLPFDPRVVLARALKPLTDMGLKVVAATELEFYLLEQHDGDRPKARLGRVGGTALRQQGIQYANSEDMQELDPFFEAVRKACEVQNLPATTAHLEFSEGQLEINLHHIDDVITACDHAVLLKRLIKGVAHEQGMAATFMAKPWEEHAGNGLHIHVSLYDEQGNNIFADPDSDQTPPMSDKLRHAIGGLQATMAECMAIFAPNGSSYKRIRPDHFAPVGVNWGYNHRDLALRIPVSNAKNLRIEHRVAGADANPYLVMACILMGLHHGLTQALEPSEMIQEATLMEGQPVTLPLYWPQALELFDGSKLLPEYLGKNYCTLYSDVRWDECEQYHGRINEVDLAWYLRSS